MAICSAIAAVAENGVIGKDNDLIWYIPEDLKYFKRVTSGKPVIMGRKTYESIIARLGKPLPGRKNIVITTQGDYKAAEGVEICHDIDSALIFANQKASDEYFILGGAQIYAAALERCERLYITEVHHAYQGDAVFPAIEQADWLESSREHHSSEQDIPAYSFVIYNKA